MAPTTPKREPTTLTAGDTVRWERTFTDFPASEGWTLTYDIHGDKVLEGITHDSVTGTSYTVEITAAQSLELDPIQQNRSAVYRWRAYMVGSGAFAGEEWTVDRGTFTVYPQTNTLGDGVTITHAQKMLAAIEAELERRAGASTEAIPTGGAFLETFSTAGRSLQAISTKDLNRLRGQYVAQVRRQRRKGRLGNRSVQMVIRGSV